MALQGLGREGNKRGCHARNSEIEEKRRRVRGDYTNINSNTGKGGIPSTGAEQSTDIKTTREPSSRRAVVRIGVMGE